MLRRDGPRTRSIAHDCRLEQEYPSSSYDKAIDDIIIGMNFEKYSQQASGLRSALATFNLHLQNLKKREACEVAIWGEILSETLEEVRFFEREKQDYMQNALSGTKSQS